MSVLMKKMINAVIAREAGYVNDPDDPGRETRWGITIGVARRWGYKGVMKLLPRDLAFKIYTYRYWHKLKLDDIEKLSLKIAEEMVDTGVNCGVSTSAGLLQRSLNALNNRAKLYADIKVDSRMGPQTINTLRQYLAIRGATGETVLFRMLNALQGARYVRLVEKREKSEKFIFGWFKNRVS